MAKEIIKLADDIYAIDEGMVKAHLVIGNEYAVLFDTGVEPGLKDCVKELTDLPVKVYHTHTDGDHTGADGEFDEIYMHPSEYEYAKIDKDTNVKPVWAGQFVKVGNYDFRVILIPGHTPGSVAYLDEEKGILFPGDFIPEGAEEFMFGSGRNIRAYKESLKKISALRDKIKVVYPPHGANTIDIDIIDDYLEMVDLILEGKLEGVEVDMFGNKVKKINHKRAGIFLL